LLNTTSATLTLAFQLLLPGEKAQAHRHNFSAVRFVVQGSGAYSTAAGEQMIMEPGDLLTQPNWAWHDHNNQTNEPCIWLDGLEARLSRVFQASFHETWPEGVSQPVAKPDGYCRRVYGALRPQSTVERGILPPAFSYKWGDTLRALEELAATEGQGDPYDGVLLEYANPITGGHTFPIMTCTIQMLRPGETTRRHRHTGTTQHHVVRGNGVTIVDEAVNAPPGMDPQEPVLSAEGVDLAWSEKDCFIVPSWRWHRHRNSSNSQPAILFSMSDRPILESAGLYREERG
jgi:gentisate 1,2-dioxygenase